eukprot:gene5243-biopygen4175
MKCGSLWQPANNGGGGYLAGVRHPDTRAAKKTGCYACGTIVFRRRKPRLCGCAHGSRFLHATARPGCAPRGIAAAELFISLRFACVCGPHPIAPTRPTPGLAVHRPYPGAGAGDPCGVGGSCPTPGPRSRYRRPGVRLACAARSSSIQRPRSPRRAGLRSGGLRASAPPSAPRGVCLPPWRCTAHCCVVCVRARVCACAQFSIATWLPSARL